jgi:luciferase family oxidoreductase group 1
MRLSILDQSPVIDGSTAAEAIAQTIDLVERADRWGYHRYWFAEHHGSASFASAAPEVMMAHAAARTTRIRLGSGGILLGHGSALHIAEQVRTLSALAPGRIDAGFGRAPGGDQRVMQALGERPLDAMTKLDAVVEYLRDMRVPSQQGASVAVPDGVEAPEVWILGTSPSSAIEAARRGLPYAFGSFIDPTHIDEALSAYHANFVPGPWRSEPRTLIATVAFAGETDADAQRMAACSEQWFVESFLRGRNVRFPAIGRTPGIDLSGMESMIRDMRRSTVLIGEARNVRERLHAMCRRYATDEIAIVTITDDHSIRCASYEALCGPIG